jgi:hypothetical protein
MRVNSTLGASDGSVYWQKCQSPRSQWVFDSSTWLNGSRHLRYDFRDDTYPCLVLYPKRPAEVHATAHCCGALQIQH